MLVLGHERTIPPGLDEPRGATDRLWIEWPWTFLASAATWIDGKLLLLAEHRDGKGGVGTVSGLLTPQPSLPPVCLTLGLYLQGGRTVYEIGPRVLRSTDSLARELQRIAALPASTIVDAEGRRKLMPVVLLPRPGVTVRAVAEAWDAAVAASYLDVSSPAQEAWVLAEHAKTKR